MPLRLRVIPPSSHHDAPAALGAERAIDFDDGVGLIRIGRRSDLELSLPFAPLSGVHARLVRASEAGHADRWMLEDLGSTNGTFVGGERVKPGTKCPVTAGTLVRLAEVQLDIDGGLRVHRGVKVHGEAPAQRDGSAKVAGEASNKGSTGKVTAE